MKSATAEEVATAQQRVDHSPDDVDARIELISALVSFLVERNEPLTADQFGPHFLFLVANAPARAATNSADIVLPGTDWHRRLEQAWSEASDRHPVSPEVLLRAASFYLGVDDERARVLTRRAFELAPDAEETRTSWGVLQLQGVELGRLDCSSSTAAALLDPMSNFPPRIDLAALARWLNGDAERAEELARRALGLAAPFVLDYGHLGHTVLGLARFGAGQVQAAIAHLRESAAHPVGQGGPSLRLACTLLTAGHTDSVVDFLRSMGRKCPEGGRELGKWADDLESGLTLVLPNRLDTHS